MPNDLNFPFDVQQMIAELPADLNRAILDTLSNHIGRENVISRKLLVDCLAPDLAQAGRPPHPPGSQRPPDYQPVAQVGLPHLLHRRLEGRLLPGS